MLSEPGLLAVQDIHFAYGATSVLHGVSLHLAAGDSLALAGPNGSGKSTLLSILAGSRRPSSGMVSLDGEPLGRLSSRTRARTIAVVPQQMGATLSFPIEMLVCMGRTPHTGFLGGLTADDRRAVREALAATETLHLAGRRFNELSGGEQQRVIIAMALAQETPYMLLDEPTVHLDLHHQRELLELLRSLHSTRGIAILAVMHDLNLAALYFDRLAVMTDGRMVADGPAASVMGLNTVLDAFRTPLARVTHPSAGIPQVLIRPEERPRA